MSDSYYQSVIADNDNLIERYVSMLMFEAAFGLKEEIDLEGFLVPIYRKISRYNTGQKLDNLENRIMQVFANSDEHTSSLMKAKSFHNYIEILLISNYDLASFQIEEIERLVTDFVTDILEQFSESYR